MSEKPMKTETVEPGELEGLSPERRELLEMLLREQEAEPAEGPLSYSQRGLWFLDQLERGSPTYIQCTAVRLSGRLDRGALARGVGEVVRRHEALRATFQTHADGEPIQVIAPRLRLAIPHVDLSGLPAGRREGEARRLGVTEARRAFDLARGPLLRVTLLELGGREHVALLALHHIVSDGWSMGVLVGEIAALYGAFSRGEPSPLPELPLQFPDYVEWQREWMESGAPAEQLAGWVEHLAGAPVLELPTDRPRRPRQRPAVDVLSMEPPGDAFAGRLRTLCQARGATPFMVFLAAFQALLARYTGQRDLVVGVPVANRCYSDLEQLIGLFINTLALRGDLSGDPTFGELLDRVRQATVDAYARQDLPFERLIAELNLERDLSRAPLFQVIFQVQNTPGASFDLRELTLGPFDLGIPQAGDYDLVVTLYETPRGPVGTWVYNTDLFDRRTVEAMAEHFRTLLEAAVADPSRRLSALPLLSERERRQLLVEWPRPAAVAVAGQAPGELRLRFEARAAEAPEAPAVHGPGGCLSYGDLNRRANRLARHLRSLGVGPGARIALCVERSPEMVVGLLGVLKSGNAYVPLDPTYPADRLEGMLGDCGAGLLLTQAALREQAAALIATAGRDLRLLCLDGEEDPTAGESEENPPAGIGRWTDPDLPAYVIYTSGSTGRPKGIVALNRGLDAFAGAKAEILSIRPGDRFLVFPSFSFDASLVSIAPTLAAGAALVVHPRPMELSTAELLEFCAAQEVTLLDLPVTFLRQLVAELAAGGLPGPGFDGAAVRAFLTGGESLPREALLQWAGLVREAGLGTALFLSSYGPTETTVTASVFTVTAADADSMARPNVPLGRPLPGAAVYVLDEHLEPVPAGVQGDLYVGGHGVTQGYLGRPDLTAAVFLPDPLAGEPGARFCRTGDRGRWIAGGNLEFLGRADHQVKVRGFRVEPGEIEAALLRHPSVAQAVVTARDDLGSGGRPNPADRRLVAYVVLSSEPAGDGGATVPELRALVRSSLPDYMVPSHFLVLESLPLTPGGKVDLRALPRPEERPELERPYTAPRDSVEEAVAGIWQELLGVDRVGVHDNFFELGGHSLLGTRVVASLRDRLGVEVPLRTLFEKPTVAELALAATELRVGESAGSDAEGLESLLAGLEGLSDEEVERLLAEGGEPAGRDEVGGEP